MFISTKSSSTILLVAAVAVTSHSGVFVDATNAYSWEPSISITDTFGDSSGLCMDIAGYRDTLNGDKIRLHTCKNKYEDSTDRWHGEDTQFVYDDINHQIRSYNFDIALDGTLSQIVGGSPTNGGCLTVNGPIEVGTENLKLETCIADKAEQAFIVMGEYIKVVGTDLCVAKRGGIVPANNGNNGAELGLVVCDDSDVPPKNKKFTIAGAIEATNTCPVAGDSCTSHSDCRPNACGLRCNANTNTCAAINRNLRGPNN